MSDINDRIAKVKGWEWSEKKLVVTNRHGIGCWFTHWRNPQGEPANAPPPDFTGTLEGMAGLMREIMEEGQHLVWTPQVDGYMCADADWPRLLCWFSGLDRPGDCVGEAYLSVKEAGDAM